MDDVVMEDWQTLTEAVQQTVGHASVCWQSMEGTGVFDEQEALKASQTLIDWVNERFELKEEYK